MDFRLSKFVFRFSRLFFFVITFYEISAIFLVFQIKLIAKTVDLAIFRQVGLPHLQKFLFLILIMIVVRFLFIFLGDLGSKKISIGVKSVLRKLLLEKIVGESNLMGKNSAELQSIFIDDIESIDAYFSQFLPQVFLSFLIPITFLLLVFPIDLLSSIIFLFTAPLIPFFMYLIGKYSNKKNALQINALHQMSAFFLDSIQGIKTLILLNQTNRHQKRIENVSEDFRRKTIEVLKVSFLSALTLELLSTISTAIIAVQIGIRLLYGQLSFELAFFILLISPEFYLPLRNLGIRFHAALTGIEAANHVFQIIYSQQKKKSVVTPSVSRTDICFNDPIRFRNVSYSYRSGVDLLTEIDFDIDWGTKTAIVGQNGVGKSTIFQLLMRFIEPNNGQILIGNQPITAYSIESWRNQFAWLPQNPIILNDSIRNNLKLSNEKANDLALVEVLEKVQLWDSIKQFRNGLDTHISDFGNRFSSGEMQRLSFARILLRNSPIILLDEPTSFLDTESETIIIELIKSLSKSSSVITIAHRLSSVLHSDQIIFLQNKKVAAFGHHKDLITNNPMYASFCQAYFEALQ